MPREEEQEPGLQGEMENWYQRHHGSPVLLSFTLAVTILAGLLGAPFIFRAILGLLRRAVFPFGRRRGLRVGLFSLLLLLFSLLLLLLSLLLLLLPRSSFSLLKNFFFLSVVLKAVMVVSPF